MKSLFFYGTLRDPALLRAVLGASVDASALCFSAAVAPGWRAVSVEGGGYPVLVQQEGERAEGLLIEELPEPALERLIAYEGPEYRLAQLSVAPVDAGGQGLTREATVFLPVVPPPEDAPDWSFEAWLENAADLRRAASSALGRLYDLAAEQENGRAAAETLAALTELWPDILGDAARTLGRAGPITSALGAGFGRESVVEDASERVYDAFFKVDSLLLRHRTYAAPNTLAPQIERAVFRMGDAVGVLPYDPRSERVLLIQQFRAGPWSRGDVDPWQVEIVAGRVEAAKHATEDDPAAATARREATEEAGLTLGRLLRLEGGYASPGATDETLTLFAAETRLPPPAGGDLGAIHEHGVFGVAEEGEDIRVFSLGLDRALEALSAGEISNLPAQLGLFWLARRRPQLRALWRRPGPLD